jgi:hypothetical protein
MATLMSCRLLGHLEGHQRLDPLARPRRWRRRGSGEHVCALGGGEDLISSGDEAGSVERRRRRDEEQWIRAGELPYRSRGAVDRSDTGERT